MARIAGSVPRVIIAVSILVAAQSAYAQPAAKDAAIGQKLSEQFCTECHVVVPNGAGGWTDAPSFDAIANKKDVTRAKLTSFIQRPHMHMLNTQRPEGEADAIATYIMSLRKS